MEYEDEEELAQCPSCGAIIPADALVCPECGVEFEVEEEGITEGEEDITEGLGEDLFGEEEEDEVEEDENEKVRHTGKLLFPAGLLLSILGLGGVAGLRSGIVQSIMGTGGGPNTIGSKEWTGILVSLVIFAVGLILIWVWGNWVNSED